MINKLDEYIIKKYGIIYTPENLVNNILDHVYYNTQTKHSLDIKDFDINFVKGLQTEDALANLNFFTAKIIAENINKRRTEPIKRNKI